MVIIPREHVIRMNKGRSILEVIFVLAFAAVFTVRFMYGCVLMYNGKMGIKEGIPLITIVGLVALFCCGLAYKFICERALILNNVRSNFYFFNIRQRMESKKPIEVKIK